MRVLQDANAELMRSSLPGCSGAGAQLFAALADAKAALSLLAPKPQSAQNPKPSSASPSWHAPAAAAATASGSGSGLMAAAGGGERGASALGGAMCGQQPRGASGAPLAEAELPSGVRTPVGWGTLEGFGSGRALEASLEGAASPGLACTVPDPASAANTPREAAVPLLKLGSGHTPLPDAHAQDTPAGGMAGPAAAAGAAAGGSGDVVAGSGVFAARQQGNACSQRAVTPRKRDAMGGLEAGFAPHGCTPEPVSGSPLVGPPLSSRSWAVSVEDDKENAPAAPYCGPCK